MIVAKDKTELHGFDHVRMPELHGHVKLTLRNVHNGKTEVIEGDNIVTDAVKDIMKANYLGGIDYAKMFPLWQKWFGGVLCFNSAFSIPQGETDPDPSDYYPSSSNTLIAHAGQTAIDVEHDDDLKRGNPLTSSYVKTDNSMKLVFEWGTTHGNGTIRALALTHSDTGSYGLGSDTYGFKNNFEPFAVLNQSTDFWNSLTVEYGDPKSVQVMYDDTHALAFYKKDTNTITVYIRKLAYLKSGLHQTLETSTELQSSFDVTIPFNLYANPCFYFDYTNKYLYIFHNLTSASAYDDQNIKYCVIDCENEVLLDLGSGVYYKTIQSDAHDIAPLGMGMTEYANILKIGDNFYFPTSSSPVWSGNVNYPYANVTGYKKIDITSPASQSTISFNEVQSIMQSPMGAGDIFINNGRVVNGATGYTCKQQFTPNGPTYHNLFLSTPDKPITYAQWLKKDDGYTTSIAPSRFLLANKLLLTTKYNLTNAVTKTTSQSMTLEYTLTES